MLSVFRKTFVQAGLATLLAAPAMASTRDVTGLWITDDGLGAVQIDPCGTARCGHIVWLKQPLDAAGKPMHDVNNPDPVARRRPLCGVEVISNLQPQGDGSWDGGTIYDPEEGKSYSVMLKPAGADRLEVTGYLGFKALGETMIWTRGERLEPCRSKPR
jgi:uncharacterized protein (DUF2147 family)